MVLVKALKFFHLLILGKKGQENVFDDILERKKACPANKNKDIKKLKIGVFPKGLVHGFGQKLTIFPSFYLRQNRPRKCVLRYCKTEKHFSRL